MKSPLIARVEAAQATLDAFRGRPLEYGTTDCVRMAAHVLRGLGYKPRLSRGGRYSNALGARRALKRAGFDTLEAALDSLGLTRTAFASALPGDLVGLESGEDWPALGVVLGNRRVLAFSPHHGVAGVCEPKASDIRPGCVWRAEPCLTRP